MAYRKFKADHLFTGSELLDDKAVLITTEHGIIKEIVTETEAGEDIEYKQGLLCPGLINTHCHLELSHMQGIIPQGTGLVEFLTRVIKERNFSHELVYGAMRAAEKELYDSGVVAVADICNTADSIPVKNSSGIYWQNFIEVIGFTEMPYDRFQYAERLLAIFQKELKQGVLQGKLQSKFSESSVLTPHAPYSVSEQLFKLLNKHAGSLLSIHNQESQAENDLYLSAEGKMFDLYKNLNIDPSFFRSRKKSSLQTYLPWLTRPSKIILVHNTFTDEKDLEFVSAIEQRTSKEFFFCICANANTYIENCLPPIPLLLNKNKLLTLGTDSYASNSSLNLLDEMKTLLAGFAGILKLENLLRWATMNGALALGIESWAGSFEKDKCPGVVHISEIKELKLTPLSQAKRIL